MMWRNPFDRRTPQRIEPLPVATQPLTPGMKKLVGVVGAAAVGLIAVVSQWEGAPTTKPHWDRIGRVWDVCYADTQIEKRTYTEAECRDILASRLADYASAVLARNPELRGHDAQLLAASSLTYNIGEPNYRISTAAKKFSAGDWKGACNAFRSWNKVKVPTKSVSSYRARGETCTLKKNGQWYCTVKGLTARREAERKICLRGL